MWEAITRKIVKRPFENVLVIEAGSMEKNKKLPVPDQYGKVVAEIYSDADPEPQDPDEKD